MPANASRAGDIKYAENGHRSTLDFIAYALCIAMPVLSYVFRAEPPLLSVRKIEDARRL